MESPHEMVTKKISEKYGISLEEAQKTKKYDWQEGTHYCDGGFDFEQPFEVNGILNSAYYYHRSNAVVVGR